MSKAISPQSVASLLRGNETLSALHRSARMHGDAGQQPADLLPPALADKVTLVRDETRLIILARNNSVAQLVRFHAARIRQLTGLEPEVRVRPEASPASPAAKPAPPRLPDEAAACLNQAADTVGDSDLAESLRRLASRAKD